MIPIAIIIGTRPEAIKLAPLVLEMQRPGSHLMPVVCLTGQHRQMLMPVLEWFNIRAHHDLELMQANQQLAEFAARALTALNQLFAAEQPAAVVIQGDTTSAAIASLAAFYQRIPVAHVEAGLRTGDLDNPFPEEMNRRVAAVLTRFHFPPTATSEQALLAERIPAANIFQVGNTVVDALRITLQRLKGMSPIWQTEPGQRILVTAHRRESFGSPFEEICLALRDIAERHSKAELVYPVHLNPNVRDPVSRLLTNCPRIRLIEPMRYQEFVHAMSTCDFILTDSGGIQEEATVLGKPTLVLRDTTERPEALASGTVRLVGTSREKINAAADALIANPPPSILELRTTAFGDGYACRRIVEILSARLHASVNASSD